MKQVVAVVSTEVTTYLDRPGLRAYAQVWQRNDNGTYGTIISKSFDDLTREQWLRFRRLQDALALLQAAS